MNNLKGLISASNLFLRNNSPAILTGIGVSGTIVTAVLAGKAGYQASRRLSEQPPKNSAGEILAETWDLYIPPLTAGVVTVGAIIMASRVSSKRAAAAYSVLAVSERAFDEYREKVAEVIGEKKEQKIRDEVVQDRINQNPPSLVIAEGTDVICCELYTGRYFKSNMESLRRAENEVNSQLVRDLYVTLDELYYILDLDRTTTSSQLGWTSEKLMKLEFSTVMTPDNKPCLAFEYNYVKPV